MAVSISLILEEYGTTVSTLDINSGDIMTQNLPMSTPEVDVGRLEMIGDGDAQTPGAWRTVTETLELLVMGASAAATAANVQSIESYLTWAKQGAEGYSPRRVFLQVQFDHDDGAWRSQVLGGQLVMARGGDQIGRRVVEAGLVLTRRYFWEDATERNVALTSNANGTATTAGVTVYNADDSSADQNWWKALAAQVTGTIPAPAKIEIKNTSGALRRAVSFFLGNYALLSDYDVDVNYAPTSGLWAASKSLTAGSETDHTWSVGLSTALLTAAGRRYMRAVLAWDTLPTSDTLLRGKTRYNSSGTYLDLHVGQQLAGNGEAVMDLGAFALFPGGIPSSPASNIVFSLTTQAQSSQTPAIKWLMFFPAGAGQYRRLRGVTTAAGLDANETLVDDGIDGVVYETLNAGGTLTTYRGYGGPLYLYPGRDNFFRMLIQGQTSVETGYSYLVKVKYRPRRLTF